MIEKSVFITGASSGIGHACALKLARENFRVFAGVRRREDADRLACQAGANLLPVIIDVSDGESIRAAAELIRARVAARGLGGLVNNAGIGLSGPLEYLSPQLLRHQFEVNVFGQLAVTQALLPLIRLAQGRIVNMGSVGGRLAIPFGGALCASKGAFAILNDALRLELHPFGVRVILIEPGAIATPAVDKTLGAVEETIGALPADGVARYGELLREFARRAYERERRGSSPDVVAAVVLRALTARRPRARYAAGKDARLLSAMPRLLPVAILDRLRYRLFGIPARLQAPAR